jgi:hypothetical protein
MLTCDCGARFEVDDALAGREVACPECQQPVKVPGRQRKAPRTSAYALASVVVALVGAFTPATLVAVLLGIAALVNISRNRGRVAGAGFAVFGIILGLSFGTLTLFALSSPELFGLGGWIRERTVGQQLDTSGPLEIVEPEAGFALTRPSEKWGQVRGGRLEDVLVSGFQKDRDLILVQPAHYAFVDVHVVQGVGFGPLDRWQDEILAELGPARQKVPRNAEWEEDDEPPGLHAPARLLQSRRLEDDAGREGREYLINVRVAGQHWRFLVRLYRIKKGGSVYIVRAYTQTRRFAAREAELRQALDSFRILQGR